MRLYRPLIIALLPVFAGCQVFKDQPDTASADLIRQQGELRLQAGQLLFRPCLEQRTFLIANDGTTGIAREAAGLFADGAEVLFADVRGRMTASKQSNVDGQLALTQVYRVQAEGQGCDDPNFKRTTLQAGGQEPFWSVSVSGKGLVLNRPGQAPLALPYLEEQLPDSRFNLTSEANGQRLELWVAPQRCVNDMSGAVQHLSAELRLNGEVMRGCAYFGGARNE